MRVWVVATGEPVPVEEAAGDRMHRGGYLAHFLAAHGHDVTWWTTTFDHFRKKHLFAEDAVVRVNPHLEIRLQHGCGYRSNVSAARFRDHWQVGRKFARCAAESPEKPDLIVAGLPTLALCYASVKYGLTHGVPVVLDMQDMWPDIFLEVLPRALRPLGRMVLEPMFYAAYVTIRDATALIGPTDPFVDWGLQRGRRKRSSWDRSFNFGCVQTPFPAEQLAAADRFWDERGIHVAADEFNVVFFGTIARQFNFEPIFEAARQLGQSGRRIRFVLCGDGDRLEYYKALAAGLDNVVFPGWIGGAEIVALMRRAAVGLAPYRESRNFTMNVPNKPADYFAGGLPVALSLKYGVLCDLLRHRDCGFSYGDDANELVRRLAQLYDHPDERKRLSTNARALFEEAFAAEKVYRRIMDYLNELVAAYQSGTLCLKQK
jgi:glycosyltransferase involved in cell wall biosynthesis